MSVPLSHPRYESLRLRERVEEGVQAGITTPVGLIAHGRGEAFDYLLRERTHSFALDAMQAAIAMLLTARRPVISVNGNTAALVPSELVRLGVLVRAPLEVNIFHTSSEREKRIGQHLLAHGAGEVLFPDRACEIQGLESNRRFVNRDGIFRADVIFVPLEDGDRAEALINCGKKVITIDLNPSSRTSRKSSVTIVDNVVRALPLMIALAADLKRLQRSDLDRIMQAFRNDSILSRAREEITTGFISQSENKTAT